MALLRRDDAAQQVEQAGLAAARRALQENPFAIGDGKALDIENPGTVRMPTEDQISDFDQTARPLLDT